MHREIFPGVSWVQECGPDRTEIGEGSLSRTEGWYRRWYEPGRSVHIPQNLYLLRGERTLALDTLSPASGEHAIRGLEGALDDRPLDYLVVSHPDVPHAGNTARILRRWPECTLVAPARGETHALYHLENAVKVAPGDEIDLGGLVARFHEAVFLDAPLHLWMTEETTNTLFSVDWMGFPHMDGECLRCADELDRPVGASRMYEFHGRVLFWLQYVDVPKTRAVVDRLWEALRPDALAPGHGLPIREGVRSYFEAAKEVVSRVAESGRIGVL